MKNGDLWIMKWIAMEWIKKMEQPAEKRDKLARYLRFQCMRVDVCEK